MNSQLDNIILPPAATNRNGLWRHEKVFFFDGFEATIKLDHPAARQAAADEMLGKIQARSLWAYLEQQLGCKLRFRFLRKKELQKYRYKKGAAFEDAEGEVARVYWGDNSQTVFIKAGGRQAVEIRAILRSFNKTLRVKQLDAAVDFIGDYQQLRDKIIAAAQQKGWEVDRTNDNLPGGSSIYLHRKTLKQEPERRTLIFYEKGKESGGNPKLLRLEARYRPRATNRRLAALNFDPLTAFTKTRAATLAAEAIDLASILSTTPPPRPRLSAKAIAFERWLTRDRPLYGGNADKLAQVRQYAAERLVNGDKVRVSEVGADFADWCQSHGKPLIGSQLGRYLRQAGLQIETKQRRVNGERTWCFIGIGLKP